MPDARIQIYGAYWCSDSRRATDFLEEHRIPYEWHDIDEEEAALDYVKQLNNGKRVLPTVVLADGSVLVEPSNSALAGKLGISMNL